MMISFNLLGGGVPEVSAPQGAATDTPSDFSAFIGLFAPVTPEVHEVPEFRSPGVPEFRSSEVPEFRSSEVPEFRSAEVPESRGPVVDGVPEGPVVVARPVAQAHEPPIAPPLSDPIAHLPGASNAEPRGRHVEVPQGVRHTMPLLDVPHPVPHPVPHHVPNDEPRAVPRDHAASPPTGEAVAPRPSRPSVPPSPGADALPSAPAPQLPIRPVAQPPDDAANQLPIGPPAQRPTGPSAQPATDPGIPPTSDPSSQLPIGPPAQLLIGPAAQLPNGPTAQLPSGTSAQPLRPTAEDGTPALAKLIDVMRWQRHAGGGHAEVQLRPEYLGAVTVTVQVQHGVVKATIVAQTTTALDFLMAEASGLEAALAEHGLTLDAFELREDPGLGERRPHDDPRESRRESEEPRRRKTSSGSPAFADVFERQVSHG